MIESEGKKRARALFYRECVPHWLSTWELQRGNALVLLGDKPREIPHLDRLGIARERISSVEHDFLVYEKQRKQELGVALYCGELTEYLRTMLHADKRFRILNLDIQGSYLANIDSAMTSVLLFANKYPKTVIAAYATVGRDIETIMEGIRSYAILLWIAGDTAKAFLRKLMARYSKLGKESPLYMAFRDLFIIRSMLEHALVVTAIRNDVARPIVSRFFRATEMLWDGVIKDAQVFFESHRNRIRLIRFEKLVETSGSRAVLFTETGLEDLPSLSLSINRMMNAIYRADKHWSQRCYFMQWRNDGDLKGVSDWCTALFDLIANEPLLSIRANGVLRAIDALPKKNAVSPTLFGKSELEWFKPRRIVVAEKWDKENLAVPPAYYERHAHNGLQNISLTPIVFEKSAPARKSAKVPPKHKSRKVKVMTTKSNVRNGSNGKIHYVSGGMLTVLGKAEVKRLAEQGFSPTEILTSIPAKLPKQSVIALVAIARRDPKIAARAEKRAG